MSADPPSIPPVTTAAVSGIRGHFSGQGDPFDVAADRRPPGRPGLYVPRIPRRHLELDRPRALVARPSCRPAGPEPSGWRSPPAHRGVRRSSGGSATTPRRGRRPTGATWQPADGGDSVRRGARDADDGRRRDPVRLRCRRLGRRSRTSPGTLGSGPRRTAGAWIRARRRAGLRRRAGHVDRPDRGGPRRGRHDGTGRAGDGLGGLAVGRRHDLGPVAGSGRSPAGAMAGVTAGGPGLVAVGASLDSDHALVWLSSDGAELGPCPGPGVAHVPRVEDHDGRCVAGPDGTLVAVGWFLFGQQFGQGTSWTSPDGRTWTRARTSRRMARASPAR